MKTYTPFALGLSLFLVFSLSKLSAQQIFLSGKHALPGVVPNSVLMNNTGTYKTASDPALEFSFQLAGSKEWQRVGPLGKKLRPFLADDPQALKYLDIYKRKRLTSSISFATGVVTLVSAIAIVVVDVNNGRDRIATESIVMVPMSLLAFFTSAILGKSSNQDINTAVMIYNQNKGYVQNHRRSIRIQPSLGYANSNSSLLAGVSMRFN